MIWLALLASLVTHGPETAGASSDRLYERPLVRPYEPPSDFGREEAEGDDEGPIYRKPLAAPVAVDDYRHSYEVTRGDADVDYDQNVTQAELDYDARMGPLDGRWTVRDADGRDVLQLALVDMGDDRMVEGAWMRRAEPGSAGDIEPIEAVRRDLVGRVSIWLGSEGSLTLSPTTDGGWAGVLQTARGTQPVSVRRPS